MKVSSKGRYALRMMIDIARHDTGEWISIKDIFRTSGDLDKIFGTNCDKSQQIRIIEEQPWAARRIHACETAGELYRGSNSACDRREICSGCVASKRRQTLVNDAAYALRSISGKAFIV